MFYRSLFFFIILACSSLAGETIRPTYFTEEQWLEIEPYLLPEDHPAKPALDRIFSSNCLKKRETVSQAGFKCLFQSGQRKIHLGRHADLQGYVIKFFVDTQPVGHEWENWIIRINGVEIVRDAIADKGYGASFKVPKKWIYLLPCKDLSSSGRHTVLLAEDMEIVPLKATREQWRKQATLEELYMFWDLLETCGLNDSVFLKNIPFSTDGRYAFVDTEYYLKWPIKYYRLNKYLKGEKLTYWKRITNQE